MNNRFILTRPIIAGLLFSAIVCSYATQAATYYVAPAPTGNDANSGTSSSSPKRTIGAGMALMSGGGHTLMIADGTYSSTGDYISVSNVRNGSATAGYNTIRAVNDGYVTIGQGFDLPQNNTTVAQYLRFEGLKWDTTAEKSIKGHHIKFLRCAFKGGPPNNNRVNVTIGTNDRTPGAEYILIEDSWAYGRGGRYNILVYNSDKVILRRVVVRHDGGWDASAGTNPEAGITVYNSSDTLLQNAIVLDSNLAYTDFESAFYNVGNVSSLNTHRNGVTTGSISLNNTQGNSYAYDDSKAIQNARIENSVAWGNKAGIAVGGSTGVAHNVTATGLTIGATAGHGFALWNQSASLAVTNSIIYGNSGEAFHNSGIVHSFNNCSGNSTNCAGSGETIYNPRSNGLIYLPRIESGALKTAGSGGAQVGAQIVQRMGTSGTLFGEVGYNVLTTETLWPWPNEARIKADMSAVVDELGTNIGTRGFCRTTNPTTLTDYIWSYLGTATPAFPLAAPRKLGVTKGP